MENYKNPIQAGRLMTQTLKEWKFGSSSQAKNHDQLRGLLRTKGIWSEWWKNVVIKISYEEGPAANTWVCYAYCFLIPFWISLSTIYTYLHQYEKKTGETDFAVDVGPCWLSEHLGRLKMHTLSLHCHSCVHRLVKCCQMLGLLSEASQPRSRNPSDTKAFLWEGLHLRRPLGLPGWALGSDTSLSL